MYVFRESLHLGERDLYLGGKGFFQEKWLLSREQGHI